MCAKVIITGSIADLPLVNQIKAQMKETVLVSCGFFNIKQLGALAKRVDLFITADTGPLHIANAVGARKIIAIFGPTAKEITGPYPSTNTVVLQKDIGCPIPCYKVYCKDNRCMKAVTPDDVLAEAKKIDHVVDATPVLTGFGVGTTRLEGSEKKHGPILLPSIRKVKYLRFN